jgi:hypothetical protein
MSVERVPLQSSSILMDRLTVEQIQSALCRAISWWSGDEMGAQYL